MPNVLIVDDALVMRKIIGSIAVEAGWTVSAEAENGQKALDAYKAQKPDLVTMDLVMPVMGGLEALRLIRDFDPQARIVVISAVDQKHALEEAIEAGAADFIVKPFDRAYVRKTFEKLASG
jgi:two-component system chemotaxis response regulator CheY